MVVYGYALPLMRSYIGTMLCLGVLAIAGLTNGCDSSNVDGDAPFDAEPKADAARDAVDGGLGDGSTQGWVDGGSGDGSAALHDAQPSCDAEPKGVGCTCSHNAQCEHQCLAAKSKCEGITKGECFRIPEPPGCFCMLRAGDGGIVVESICWSGFK